MSESVLGKPHINIDEPRFDQRTYSGRAKHFFITTNPLNLFISGTELDKAKDIVQRYRKREVLDISEDELWRAKSIYDSAFHPDTGEKMILIGRMSAQVPMNMSITGCMLTFYKTTPAVVFWQWVNQSFNAVVNYTNRSGDTPVSPQQLGACYLAGTGGALATALGLNSLTKTLPPIVGRMVPFTAVAAANCINVPMMRMKELEDGVTLIDKNGNPVGESKIAAQRGIASVVVSRVLMASPGMVLPAFVMNHLEKKGTLGRFPWIAAPLQVALCGICLVSATPLCCALFPQKASIAISSLETDIQEKLRKNPDVGDVVYYNKGL